MKNGARGSVVKALCHKLEGHGFETRWGEIFQPGVHSATNRNEYQKQKNILRNKVKPVRKAGNLTAIC
jgi:hypothetical protein